MEVLSHGKFLKGSTISVREDLSLRVRERQKGLMPLMKNLRDKKKKATLCHDKLVINLGVFTYDPNTITVVPLKQTKSKATHINAGATQGSEAVTTRYADRTRGSGGDSVPPYNPSNAINEYNG